MNPLKVGYKLLHPDAQIPTYAHPGDAGADLSAVSFELPKFRQFEQDEHANHAGWDCHVCNGLRSVDQYVLQPDLTILIHTELAVAIPPGWEATIRPRSGLAFKHGVTMFHPIGTIDERYRGSLDVLLTNRSAEPFPIKKGDRVAQIVFTPVGRAEFITAFDEGTGRGLAGYGSSGGYGAKAQCEYIDVPHPDYEMPCTKPALGRDAQGTNICEAHARGLLADREEGILGKILVQVLEQLDGGGLVR